MTLTIPLIDLHASPEPLDETVRFNTDRLELQYDAVLDLEDLTKGQRTLINYLVERKASKYLWRGSVRQGKTAGAVMGLSGQVIRDTLAGVGNGNYLLGGVTIESIVRNQKKYWQDVCGQLGLRFVHRRNPMNVFEVGDCVFYLFGLDNEGAAGRMRGITATSGHIDELTKCVQSGVEEMHYRCSYGESFVLMTTNSDSPNHWAIEEYSEDANCPVIESDFEENQHYSDERRQELLNENQDSVAYKRNVLNLNVPDTGLVFPIAPAHLFDNEKPPWDLSKQGLISVDVGTSGTTAILLWRRIDRQRWAVCDEYVHVGTRDGIIAEEELIRRAISRWGNVAITEVVVDPSAVMFITRSRQMGLQTLAAKNDILPGVHSTNNALSAGNLFIAQQCKYLLRQASAYAWNIKTGKPFKKDDHAVDSLRYGTMHVLPPIAAAIYTR